MKLLYCTVCHDIVRLGLTPRECRCGKSKGQYLMNGLRAVMSGECVPIGIDNTSFKMALETRPESGLGMRFDAFIIPRECSTVEEE